MCLWEPFRYGRNCAPAITARRQGVVPALEKIVTAIRKRCRQARIIVRGDSGFGREEIMAWCEGQPEVYYCLGLAKNSRAGREIGPGAGRRAGATLPLRSGQRAGVQGV